MEPRGPGGPIFVYADAIAHARSQEPRVMKNDRHYLSLE